MCMLCPLENCNLKRENASFLRGVSFPIVFSILGKSANFGLHKDCEYLYNTSINENSFAHRFYKNNLYFKNQAWGIDQMNRRQLFFHLILDLVPEFEKTKRLQS